MSRLLRRRHPRVLGVDPGFASCGYCVAKVVGCDPRPERVGLITTSTAGKKREVRKSAEDMARIAHIMRKLDEVITDSKPAVIVSEIPTSGAKSHSAAKGLAYATAIVAHLQNKYNIPLIQLSPAEIKEAWTGDKNAKKSAIIAKATSLYGDVGWPTNRDGSLQAEGKLEHPADALAALFAAVNDPVWQMLNNIGKDP